MFLLVTATHSAGDSHHEQDKRKHQPRVRGITEHLTEPGREIWLQRLLDHIKHPVLTTVEKKFISDKFYQNTDTLNLSRYLKGPQSKEGGMVTMV